MIRSFPFDAVLDSSGVPDRAYLSIDFAKYFSKFISNGVFPNPSTGLQVIAVDNNMQVRMKKGDGYIEGRLFENTDDYIFKLEPADGVLNRIDRVVLRLDYLKRDIILVLKKGTFASSPVAPILQRDADAYEIALADIYVRAGAIKINQSDVTDLRLNNSLCGIVHCPVSQVDTTTIFNQYMDWFKKTKGQAITDISNLKVQFESDFNTWFNTIKDKLNGDIAAKLTTDVNNRVIKPTKAAGNNIAIFDTNQDKLKDSGKSIGNTSGKILELPTGLTTGDLLRVGANGQVERLPKGVDGQILGYKDGFPMPLTPNNGGYRKLGEIKFVSGMYKAEFTNIHEDCMELLVIGLNLIHGNYGYKNGTVNITFNNVRENVYYQHSLGSIRNNILAFGDIENYNDTNRKKSYFQLEINNQKYFPKIFGGFNYKEGDLASDSRYNNEPKGRVQILDSISSIQVEIPYGGPYINSEFTDPDTRIILYGRN